MNNAKITPKIIIAKKGPREPDVAIIVVFKSPVGQRTHFEYNQLFLNHSALNSSQIRLVFFVEGAKLFREKPFLGHGLINRDATMFQASKIIDPKRELSKFADCGDVKSIQL